MFKKVPPVDILFPHVYAFVRKYFPVMPGTTARDKIHDAHCAAILMEGLLRVPPARVPEALRDAIAIATSVYEREVTSFSAISEADFPQASICLARLACDVLLMQEPERWNPFRRKKKPGGNK